MPLETDPFAPVMKITSRPPVVFTGGEGSWLTDSAGRRYLDFVQGWAVNCLGHGHPAISQALAAQAGALINCSPAYYNNRMVQLCGMLARASGLDQVYLANSGAEANEGALKLARKWGALHKGGAYEVITMDHGFHGRTLAMMAASGKPQWEPLFEPKVPGFIKVDLNDLDAVARAISERTVAVMLEPIQGEAGVFVAEDGYLRALRQLTKEKGVLLILDEIQTGIGRTGAMFGCQHAGVQPDIMTLAKGLGGGVPISALLAHEDVCCFAPGDQGGTFGGNALMAAVGCAVVETVSDPVFLARVQQAGLRLARRLRDLSQRHGLGEVRGRGLLLALATGTVKAPEVAEAAMAAGLLVNAPRADSLRFMPALNVSDAEIDAMADILDRVFREMR